MSRQVFPLSYRAHYALSGFIEAATKPDVDHKTIAEALIVLEHALLLPCIPEAVPHPSDRWGVYIGLKLCSCMSMRAVADLPSSRDSELTSLL